MTTPTIATAPGPAILASSGPSADDQRAVEALGRSIVSALARHGADTDVDTITAGPTVVRYDLRLGPRTKVGQLRTLQRDVAAAVGADVRLIEHLEGKAGVAFELPNPRRRPVLLGDVLGADDGPEVLRMAVGVDVAGSPVVVDLAELPHLLIGGTTGSGKSTLLHAMISSLLVRNAPADVRLIMIDPKRVELTQYTGFPHLLVPPVRDAERSVEVLEALMGEVEERYSLLDRLGARDIAAARARGIEWPYVVTVVDELADLMMLGGRALERVIVRIAQKARAVGIHLILATQRPSVDVVTGLIKANMPARIALRVPSYVDSRVILDQTGAQTLLGKGDLLMTTATSSLPVRAQAPLVTGRDFTAIAEHWGVEVLP